MNPSFKDNTGREWHLCLTVGLVMRVHAETGVDLGSTAQRPEWVQLLFSEPVRLAKVLWILCEGQAARLGVEPEAFWDVFDGEVLNAAGDALAACVTRFFPRKTISRAYGETLSQILEATEEKMVAGLREAATRATSPHSPTPSPGSSGSTPPG